MKTKLTSVLLATNVIASVSLSAQHESKKTDDRPNILFMIADDASYPHFGANGSSWVKTPGYDRVAAEGINFQSCYTPNAKSAPSRATILTGLYAWQSGEAGNHICNFPLDLKTFTDVLQENGYVVAHTGKGWGPGNPGVIDGQPRLLTGQPYHRQKLNPPTDGINKMDYNANFSDFLDEQRDDPWFFWMGCYEPHRRYEYGSGEKIGGKSTSSIDDLPRFWPDNEVVRTDMLDYAYEVEYFDKMIQGALVELEKRNLLDNTVIVVTSDNGMPFPRSKGNSYEISNHMPLAMMWKKGLANPGRVVSDYVNFVDFAPTFLELSQSDYKKAGMHQPAGKSFVNILKSKKEGQVDKTRDHVILGRERHDSGRPANQGYPIRSIIKDNFLYVYNLKSHLWPAGNPETGYGDTDGSPTKTEILNMKRTGVDARYYQLNFDLRPEEELYDLSVDKDCITNLADHPVYSKIKEKLKNQLLTTLKKQSDPRMFGKGDIFDSYPFYQDNKTNFYERVMDGSLQKPWEKTGWINPTDYEQYKP